MTIEGQKIYTQWHLDHGIQMIDYSIENMAIIKNPSSLYLPYQYEENEVNRLRNYYLTTEKKYDVAFCGTGSFRRYQILEQLKQMGINILNIVAWGDDRDRQIASCKMLLNIHFDATYNVYESIRCDRWVFAGMPIVSEDSAHDNLLDVKKYGIISFHPYQNLAQAVVNFLKNFKLPNESDIELIKKERMATLKLFI
jgi:hypothetical protein